MKAEFANESDIASWMALIEPIRWNFPGLETQAQLEEYSATVLRFIGKKQALCVREQERIIGVMLFSRGRNMICCLAVSPERRRQGVATALMQYALSILDPRRDVSVSTFRVDDARGAAPRAFYRSFGFDEDCLSEDQGHPSQIFLLRPAMNLSGAPVAFRAE